MDDGNIDELLLLIEGDRDVGSAASVRGGLLDTRISKASFTQAREDEVLDEVVPEGHLALTKMFAHEEVAQSGDDDATAAEKLRGRRVEKI